MYAIIHDQSALESALRLARGCYQRAILTGSEAISGATLRGRAKQYAGRYADSARAILRRCQSAGLPVREERGPHGKRLVVIGHATVAAAWECIPADVAERELCAA